MGGYISRSRFRYTLHIQLKHVLVFQARGFTTSERLSRPECRYHAQSEHGSISFWTEDRSCDLVCFDIRPPCYDMCGPLIGCSNRGTALSQFHKKCSWLCSARPSRSHCFQSARSVPCLALSTRFLAHGHSLIALNNTLIPIEKMSGYFKEMSVLLRGRLVQLWLTVSWRISG